ncbi:flavin-containing monooxygenase [Rhodotorula paludigena]|uniref:flavin-containing monooxygenase n=1 Tax=Rhodotorula paludigena TaxID=86838 RepID=UPI003174BE60
MSDSPGSQSDSTAVDPARSPSRRARPGSSKSNVVKVLESHLYRAVHAAVYAPFSLAVWVLYQLYQAAVLLLFASSGPHLPIRSYGRIAVIGAGLTGVSTAAHAVDHGFEVVIFEAEKDVGGVWARENSTSQLQLNSILYRFHPSVKWSKGFPQRDEIISQIRAVWERYQLRKYTRFNYRVTKVQREPDSSTDPREGGHARWIINDGKEGIFDAVVCALGTCGEPKFIELDGQDQFKGQVIHSSQLDGAELKGKKVVVIGSGASGVEAAELAVDKKASDVVVLARSDKWIIPRNTIFDILLSLQPFGRQMPLSFIPEWIIRAFHYRDLWELSPPKKGLFQGTPVVNDEFLEHIRAGKISYRRGDTQSIVASGIRFNERERGSKSGDEGEETLISADVIIVATGYRRPSIDFLPSDLFPTEKDRDYHPPSLYLQNFATEDWSILMTNASYQDGLGTVGNWHIGLLARILMVFLLDPSTRPRPAAMKTWVDIINWVKMQAWGEDASGLTFFTYSEMIIWILVFHLFNPRRLPWLPFVLFGYGVRPGTGGRITAEAIQKTEGSLENLGKRVKKTADLLD